MSRNNLFRTGKRLGVPYYGEFWDLLIAWIVLGLAFANLLGGLNSISILIALFTAGIGFLVHEIAHKLVASRFGLQAFFKADISFLVFAFVLSFIGFIFAAPGAVYTKGSRTSKQQMYISLSGPLSNLGLATFFLFIPGLVGAYGQYINAWLALFNMIPFAGLDGEEIYRENKVVFAAVVLLAIYLSFIA
ncbi:hypothetical protein [Methanonatronarchaeum sp. AMET-Sl]|uniref:hypothetical protein n=1 Tax=Methanonatronarchaeum sp. AMET-Sl TaxID=3037654 RepID=UPI00244DE8B7|nr:hypothetical protein [Methanonatronarchaeum sp. AMET-Sl]WGI17184.1 hypothetical protein QEN48_06690 [Methanonatronarchaeum sp. AMET-Sl]